MKEVVTYVSKDGVEFASKEECEMYELLLEKNIKKMVEANIISTDETCKILSRTRQQLSNYIKEGKIRPIKIGAVNVFWKPDVLKFRIDLLKKI